MRKLIILLPFILTHCIENNKLDKVMQEQKSITLLINSPMVSDRRYWETVVENYIVPAFDKLNKR